MQSVLIDVILKGIFLLAGNEICTVLAVCPACVRACPGQGAGCVVSGGWRHEEEPESIRKEECFYFEET